MVPHKGVQPQWCGLTYTVLGTLAAVLRSVTRRSSLYPRAVLMTLKIKSDSGSISKGQTTQFGNESDAGYESDRSQGHRLVLASERRTCKNCRQSSYTKEYQSAGVKSTIKCIISEFREESRLEQ